jgi:predicted PurR-regulated permease PerM
MLMLLARKFSEFIKRQLQNAVNERIIKNMGLFSSKERIVSIQTETIIKTLLLITVALLIFRFVDNASHQLRLIGIAFLLAVALNPAVTWLSLKFKSKSRVLATGVAYLLVLSFLAGLLALLVPPIAQQTGIFVQDVPASVDDFMQQDTFASRTVEQLNLEAQIEGLRDDVASRAQNWSAPLLNNVGRIGGMFVSIITVLVLAFMMLVEGPAWKKRFLALQPSEKLAQRKQTIDGMYKVIVGFFYGQVVVASFAASFALIALLIGNVIFAASVNAIALAGIIFLFALIPMVGTTLGAIVVVVTTLLYSLPFAIALAVYFVIYQQIENATLYPIIQSRTNHLTPLIVLIAVLIGLGLGGVIGALAAIPIAGCIKVFIEQHYNIDMPSFDSLKKENKR